MSFPHKTFGHSQIPQRGPRGRFISKKTTVKTPPPFIATFNGIEIRKFFINGEWYFSLEDILLLAQYAVPREVLTKRMEQESFRTVFEKVVKEELRDSEGKIACVTHEGFMTLLPLLQDPQHRFPGQLPNWLEYMSQLPYAG